MSPVQYKGLLKRFINRNFNSYKEAAVFFECSQATVTLVLKQDRSPNDAMLAATGHKRLRVNKISYVRDLELEEAEW